MPWERGVVQSDAPAAGLLGEFATNDMVGEQEKQTVAEPMGIPGEIRVVGIDIDMLLIIVLKLVQLDQ
jgi:hypothetical protein